MHIREFKMKKLFLVPLCAPLIAFAQTYPSPTFQNTTVLGTLTAATTTFTNPVPISSGGTGAATASGATLDNITGFSGTGFMSRTGAGAYSFTSSTGSGPVVLGTSPSIASPTITTPTVTGSLTATGLVTTADLATQAANTILANATGSTASPTAISIPSCSASSSALGYTSGSGIICNTSINATTLGGATFAAPGAIGSGTAGSGSFTALNASGAASLTGGVVNGSTTFYPTIPTNAALQALSTATTSIVTRLGFAASGDAPPLVYTASASACSLNAGAGDNGAQVQSSNGKCWIASFPNHVIDLTEYGAVGNNSTDSTTAISNAVSYASANNYPISIVGTFKVSSSISNLHSQNVQWIGSGAIVNGSSPMFYPNPPANAVNTNTIYLSPTGSDSNDGLSSSDPILTLNHFFAIVGHYNPTGLCSNWAASLAAGSYQGATVPYGLTTCAPGNATLSYSDGHIQINGPQPSGTLGQQVQPTAIIDGNQGPAGQTFGLGIDGKSSIQVTNVYFKNWNLECIYANPFTDLVLINDWFAGCVDFAVDARQSHVTVIGGTIDGSTVTAPGGIQTGLSFLNETLFTVTSIDNTTTNGTVMKNMSVSGMQYIENATGHIDYATINNSVIGMEAAEASHAQLDSDIVTNNSTAWFEKDASSSYLANGITNSGNGNSGATLPINIQSVPWSPYAPSVSCGSGSIGSYTANGYYTINDNSTVNLTVSLHVTTLGTCSGQVTISAPKAALNTAAIPGIEAASSGAEWHGYLNGSTLTIYRYDGTTGLASGGLYVFSGSYNAP